MRYTVEWTYKAEIRPEEQNEKAESYRKKNYGLSEIQLKGS